MNVHRIPNSMKFVMPSLKESTLVLFTVLLFIIDIKCTVDGLSTSNDRGGRKLFGGYRITPKFCKPSKILPKSDPRSHGPTICMFNHECLQREGEVVGACMDGFLFGACCQLVGSSDTTLEDYNKPLIDSIDTLSDNENRITFSTISGGSDSILFESSKPLTSTDKTSIYLLSNSPGEIYTQELPSFGSSSFSSSERPTIFTSSNKKKAPNTKQPYPTKSPSTKYGNTDKYVLIQTLSNNKNEVSAKPGISENEISSIESIILMLNDTKAGPQYSTNLNKNENFYITTKLPSETTKRPAIYNVTQTTSHISIYTPTPTSSSFATFFEKIPTFSNGIVSTTKSPSTSYVYSTAIPKRPTTINSNDNRISSTIITSNKPSKSSLIVTKKPLQKATSKPISTSYVSGPTPARPTYSTSKKPLYDSSQISNVKPQTVTEAHIINKIGTSSTPAPTLIVLGPYGIGSTENPSPTIHITPKPTANFVSSSTSWTANPDLIKLTSQKNPSSFFYTPLITKRPGDSDALIYTPGAGTIIDNDFDDSGYYGLTSTTNRPLIANIQQTVTSASIYAVLDEDALSGPITPSSVDLSNDLNNFPPVRNPNLNGTVPVSGVTIEDYDISTPQFIEDDLLNDKMGLLVNKIVESFKDNFHDLADIVENKTVYKKPFATAPITQKPIATLPTKKQPQRLTTTTRRPGTLATTTVRPNRRTTKKPITTLLATKKPLSKVTTTRRPLTKPPKRQPTTTTQQQYDDITDATELEDEGENIGVEDSEEEGSTPFFESSRVQCGVRPHVKSGRIVGGKGATFGAWPWQVLVRESTWLGLFTKNKCGGVLITTEYVMTAAHCQPGFLATLVAVFGEFDISGDLEKKRSVTKNIERIVVHREYDAATFENDLALLKTESPIHYDTHIVPICMPADNADFTGRMATVTGWGRLKYAGGVPSVLQEVQVPIIENSVCQEMFQEGTHNKKILPSFLCAGYANGLKDSCEGDSGGPLVLQRPDGRWELAGTVSHGIKCAAPYLPGVYMRTTYYKPWLHSVTGV